jgi:CheY-like chemotaxis protein
LFAASVNDVNLCALQLLLTDIVMPEMDGIELARRATELDPDLKVMFITGFAAVARSTPIPGAEGRQGAVEALPSARPRQRGREDAGGLRPERRRGLRKAGPSRAAIPSHIDGFRPVYAVPTRSGA